MQNIIFEILEDDYNDFLKKIYDMYSLSNHINYNEFKDSYKLNRLVFYNTQKTVRGKNKCTIIEDNIRCTARVWGGKDSVIKKNGIWYYGHRCKRKSINNTNMCILHSKKQPHGIYNLPPPHNHYEKYKFE